GAMTGLVGNIANDSFIRSLEKVSADLEDIVSDPQMRRVLAYTIQKESSGNFGALNKSTRPGGENQGVGMAFGAVQFTMHSGSLGKLLSDAREISPEKFAEIFGKNADLVIDITDPEQVKGLSKEQIAQRSAPLWQEEILEQLSEFAAVPEFQRLQLDSAVKDYLVPALKYLSEKGFEEISEGLMTLAFTHSIWRGPKG